MIKSMNNFSLYENFAYHISLLRQFVSLQARNNSSSTNTDDNSVKGVSSVHGNNVWNSLKKKRGLDGSDGQGLGGGDADFSTKSSGGMRRVASATGILSNMK
jgi:hypothetical protein